MPKPFDITKLSAAKLHAHIAAANARHTRVLDAVIAHGMGSYTGAQMAEIAKGSSLLARTMLARELIEARDAYLSALNELDARRRWHGGDKPIKRPA